MHQKLLLHLFAGLLWLTAAAQAAETDRGLIFRVDHDGRSSYLLGSIHLAPASLYPLPRRVMAAFAATDTLAVEADIGAVDNAELSRRVAAQGLYPPRESLRDHIDAASWARLTKVLEDYGIPLALAERQRPWLLSLTLTTVGLMSEGLQASRGIDQYFLEQARGQRPILELESAQAQLDLMAGMEPGLQRELLMATVEQLEGDALPVERMIDSWRHGDGEAIAALVGEDFGRFRAAEEALLDRRNTAMVGKIEGWLADGRRHFVVVGAAHLVGEASLVALLREAGYKVTQL